MSAGSKRTRAKRTSARKKAPAKAKAPAAAKSNIRTPAKVRSAPKARPATKARPGARAPKKTEPSPAAAGRAALEPSRRTAQTFLEEAQRDGLALVQVATVARPLGGGAVDVAALGAGAFLSIGPREEVPLLVATAIAAWAERAGPPGILVVLDQGLEDSEAAFSALASKLGREVRVREWEELELGAPNLARLATIDRAARRAFLTSLHLPLTDTAPIRIDPLALDDAASQRPVRLEREAQGYRVRPAARGRVLPTRKD